MAQSSSRQSLPKRDPEPGGLLDDLERRQDDVLNLLDDLDSKLQSVLDSLAPPSDNEDGVDLRLDLSHAFEGLSSSDPEDQALAEIASSVESLQDEVAQYDHESEYDDDSEYDDESAEDWA